MKLLFLILEQFLRPFIKVFSVVYERVGIKGIDGVLISIGWTAGIFFSIAAVIYIANCETKNNRATENDNNIITSSTDNETR